MRPRRFVVWPTKRDLSGSYVTVSRTDEDLIDVVIHHDTDTLYVNTVTRREARLIARRINQCLDGTAKR